MKDAIHTQLGRIHRAVHADPVDVDTVDDAITQLGDLVEKTPLPKVDKKKKAA